MERGDRQEAREPREIAGQPLGPDLLAQIQPDMVLERRSAISRDPDQGDGSRIEGGLKVEVVAEFGRGRRMHGLVQRPAGEPVDAGRLELSCARSEKGEVETPMLDMPVHFVEEIGKALDPVDNHPATRCRRLKICGEEGRIGKVVLVAGLVEQVDAQCIGKLRSRPRALSDTVDTKEKEALPGRAAQSGIGLFCHFLVIFLRNMTI